MLDLGLYILQLITVSVLLALALSIYMDGIGYVVLHLLGVAGVGAYAYAILAQRGWPVLVSLFAGACAGAVVGLLCAEAARALRGDGLTLATFGIGIGAFEVFRYLKITGGVYGMSGFPNIGISSSLMSGPLLSLALILISSLLVLAWRTSLGGTIVSSVRMDEWASVSVGVRLAAHQRITGALSGLLAGCGGAYFAAITGFIEPRDFRPTSLLLPLAATILAAGRTPLVVVLAAAGAVIISHSIRLFGGSPTLAGPLAEILIALAVGTALVTFRLRRRSANGNEYRSAYSEG